MSSHVDNRAVNMSRKKMRIQHTTTQNRKHDPNRRRLKNTKHDTNRRRTHKTENMIQIEEDRKTQNKIQIEEEHKKENMFQIVEHKMIQVCNRKINLIKKMTKKVM